MSYLDRHLEPEEDVLHRSRLHTAVFAWPALFLLGAVVAWANQFIETPLDAIDEVQVSRSVVGRLIGYATVRVNAHGDEHPPLPLVADPDRLAERIRERVRSEPAEPAQPVAG